MGGTADDWDPLEFFFLTLAHTELLAIHQISLKFS